MGRLWHTLRKSDTTWNIFGAVEEQTGYVGSFIVVSSDE